MMILSSIIAAMAAILLESLGQLHVTRFDVSRRFLSAPDWRKAQRVGALLLSMCPLMGALLSVDPAGRRILAEATSFSFSLMNILLAIIGLIFTFFWARLLLFATLPRHLAEATEIIKERRRKTV